MLNGLMMLPLYLMLLFYFLADIDSGIQTNARVLVSESSRQTHHAAGQENSRQNDRVARENRSAYREMKNEETADKKKPPVSQHRRRKGTAFIPAL